VSIKSKNIKRLVINQLKREYPQFKKFSRKQKKELVQKVLDEVHQNYDKQSENSVKSPELLNIQPIPKNVISLEKMEKMLSDFNAGILPLKISASGNVLLDDELTYIYDKVDWAFLNRLLASSDYYAARRKIHPVQLFRAELLKSLKYPEFSYRKFCTQEVNNQERKENRTFIGLRRKQKIAHGQLSTFRSNLNFEQMLNVVEFGKKIGLDLNIVVADQAYSDSDDEPIQEKHHVYILNQPKQTVNLPEFVTADTHAVYLNQYCETPLKYMGLDGINGHEFHCHAAPGECPLEYSCQKFRYIPCDAGVFGKIPGFLPEAKKMLSMRKVIERPFNLLKHREGLEPLRVYGRQNVTNVATIANIATLLIEMAGFRKKKSIPKNEQLTLFKDVA